MDLLTLTPAIFVFFWQFVRVHCSNDTRKCFYFTILVYNILQELFISKFKVLLLTSNDFQYQQSTFCLFVIASRKEFEATS